MEQLGAVRFVVSEDGRQLAEFSYLPDSSSVIDGNPYRLTRDGSARFAMSGPLGMVATADRDGADIVVTCPPHLLRLRRVGRFRRHWQLLVDGETAGECRVKVLSATGDVPATLPLPVRLFLFYTAIMAQQGGPVGGIALWS
jgi:hypothetical protein